MSEKGTPPLYPSSVPLTQDGLRPSIDNAQSDRKTITRLQTKNLFGKLAMLEKELEHYRKLKRRWKSIKNLLHYLKYPVGVVMLGGDALLFATSVIAPIATASSGLTVAELVGSHLIEDSVVRAKLNKYTARVRHLKEWIDRMYVFKSEGATRPAARPERNRTVELSAG